MPWLTQLADVARRTGYPVTEVPGWKTRGHGPQPDVRGIVCHHTAGASGGGDYPSLGVVRDGRPGLDGPLSHFGLGRSGRIYVIAAGLCWHNAPSTSSNHRNSASLGIEAENNGSQSWPAAQLDAYRKLCAELCRTFGLPASRVKGHKEVNTQKPDPHSIDMNGFRRDVAALIEGEDMPTAKEIAQAVVEQSINARGHTVGQALQAAKDGMAVLLTRAPADVDEEAIAAAVLAQLTPERIAAAIPAELAEQVATELGNRLSPQPEDERTVHVADDAG